MPNRIDFKLLREQLVLKQLLEHYGIQYTPKGERARCYCPLPEHESEDSSPSFSADLTKGLWQCFGCGARGNVLDFALHMEGYDPSDGKQLQAGAKHVAAHWQLQDAASSPGYAEKNSAKQGKNSKKPGKKANKKKASRQGRSASASKAYTEQPEPTPPAGGEPPEADEPEKQCRINPPLDFALKNLDPEHPYLAERGLSQSTIERFGLGHCNQGMFKGRIAIPIHNGEGQWVGYAGRLVDDEAIDADHPKYRFPPTREREGVVHEFRKAELLYNAHRMEAPAADLLVVEGFFDALWLYEQGYENVVALMGTDVSEAQTAQIVTLTTDDGRIWLMPDADEAGERCAKAALEKLAPHRFVHWLQLEDGSEPTDLSADDLSTVLW